MSSVSTASELNGRICTLGSEIKRLTKDSAKKQAQLRSIQEAIKKMKAAERKQNDIIDGLTGMRISGKWKGRRASEFKRSVKQRGTVWSDAVAVYESITERRKAMEKYEASLESEIGSIKTSINTKATEIDGIKKQQQLLNLAK